MGLGSGIWNIKKVFFRIPDPGVKKAPDPQHWQGLRQAGINLCQPREDLVPYCSKGFGKQLLTCASSEKILDLAGTVVWASANRCQPV
jgi:hypothetical protein